MDNLNPMQQGIIILFAILAYLLPALTVGWATGWNNRGLPLSVLVGLLNAMVYVFAVEILIEEGALL